MDFVFKITAVPMSARYVAARYVALRSLVKERVRRQPSEAQLDLMCKQAAEKWRSFVSKMYKSTRKMEIAEGDVRARFNDRLKLQYLRNCPPAGVITDKVSNCCRMRLICPWCYTRVNVLNMFQKLERALWDGKTLRQPVKLVEFQGRPPNAWWRSEIKKKLQEETPYDWMVAALEECKLFMQGRMREVTSLKPLGGFVLHRVVYRQEDVPLPKRSGVLVLGPDQEVDMGKRNRHFKFEIHERVTRTLLTKIFSRVCRYPDGWIQHASASDVCLYLDTFQRARMLATCGFLRKSQLNTSFDVPAEGDE